jgi:hypothetical protein
MLKWFSHFLFMEINTYMNSFSNGFWASTALHCPHPFTGVTEHSIHATYTYTYVLDLKNLHVLDTLHTYIAAELLGNYKHMRKRKIWQ